MKSKPSNKSVAVRISLRLSPALHKQLQAQAQQEHRSLHGQIVWLLESTLASRETAGPASERARHAAG
jgi:hypothetical protein